MAESAPMPVMVRNQYVGDCELLMLWGPGEPRRRAWFKEHVARGGHAIAWDLGYWNRDAQDPSLRVTIDHDHPQAFFRPMPPDRFAASGIQLRNCYDPKGPIILVGLGHKTDVMLGHGPMTWERIALERIRRVHGARHVIFRPKGKQRAFLDGVHTCDGGSIESVLQGASLVVCRHSNVAVDACIAGIPVVCEDGAAAALYGRDLSAPVMATVEQRLAFLRTLAYWQWTSTEARRGDVWHFLTETLR